MLCIGYFALELVGGVGVPVRNDVPPWSLYGGGVGGGCLLARRIGRHSFFVRQE